MISFEKTAKPSFQLLKFLRSTDLPVTERIIVIFKTSKIEVSSSFGSCFFSRASKNTDHFTKKRIFSLIKEEHKKSTGRCHQEITEHVCWARPSARPCNTELSTVPYSLGAHSF